MADREHEQKSPDIRDGSDLFLDNKEEAVDKEEVEPQPDLPSEVEEGGEDTTLATEETVTAEQEADTEETVTAEQEADTEETVTAEQEADTEETVTAEQEADTEETVTAEQEADTFREAEEEQGGTATADGESEWEVTVEKSSEIIEIIDDMQTLSEDIENKTEVETETARDVGDTEVETDTALDLRDTEERTDTTRDMADAEEEMDTARDMGDTEVETDTALDKGDTTTAEATEPEIESLREMLSEGDTKTEAAAAKTKERAKDTSKEKKAQKDKGRTGAVAEEQVGATLQQHPPSAASHPPSAASHLSQPAATLESPTPQTGAEKQPVIPAAPHFPFPVHSRAESAVEGTMSTSALNIVWSFGVNKNVPVLNLCDGFRKAVMYACSHVGVMYDFENNRQCILQGHLNAISCACVSEDKRWLVTGEKGPDAMVNVWDTYTGVPIQTLFDPNPEGGAVAVALTPDARYLATLSAGDVQVLAIWDWTIDGETPICSADLKPSYGLQNYIYFNPENIHHLVTNSETQVIFYKWIPKKEGRMIQYFAPPLGDSDFNRPVGRYSQSIYQFTSSRALTCTSIGNLVVWDNNMPLTKVVSTEQSADKKALKIIKVQDRAIEVLTTTGRYIVMGDHAGHVKFFDQSLKLIFWYQDMHLGPITSLSFASYPNFLGLAREGTNYPDDATIPAPKFVIRDFVASSSTAIIGYVTTNGTKVQIIQREHDSAVLALASHPRLPLVAIGSYSGLLKLWNYETKKVISTRNFDKGNLPQTCTYNPKGQYLVVGFTSGAVRLLDSLTLQDETEAPFHFSKEPITQIVFSRDSTYFATADAEYTTSLFKAVEGNAREPFQYLGRYRAHYKPIRDLVFGVHLDFNKPRLLSLGADRVLVEYDLENTEKDNIVIASTDRIEQSAVPTCMMLYPQITKEHFILTANDQFKLKMYNTTTKMCRKTLLGPTYGSPIKKIAMVPSKTSHAHAKHCYAAYITDDKVGLIIIPSGGNPHNAMALIAHPSGVRNMVVSHDGRYLFTAGGLDATVHMWEINTNALEAQSLLGGEDLIPFYGLLEGGREGELFAELEDYFYYAQIRSQGVNSTDGRAVSTTIPLSEIPFVMRALGFYPTEQEIEDMLSEVKFSRYVETGQYVEELDLGSFIKLYVNHRPAFGLSPDKLQWAFDVLGLPSQSGGTLDRGELLDLLQNKGEHLTEYELAEYLTTLMGFNPEGGSSEMHLLDIANAGNLLDKNLPSSLTAATFARDILGFELFGGSQQSVAQGH